VTFLPVLERELRVAARKRMTIWNRFAIALLAIGLWVVILEANRTLSTAQVSRQLFVAISVIGLIFTLFAGIFLTSDCLSIERREGTLGLLSSRISKATTSCLVNSPRRRFMQFTGSSQLSRSSGCRY